MKKKILTILLAITLLIPSVCVSNAEAATPVDEIIISRTIESLDEGYYAEILITQQASPVTRAATTKTASKHFVLRNTDGDELARFTLKGTFSINQGVSSTCTAASHITSITDTAWSVKSATSSKSGNQAIGDAEFIRKLLFITVETKTCHLTLSCDKNGNLS